jgi:hypothetical protein
MNTITRDGLPDRLRALAQDEIDGVSSVLSPGNSHDVLTAADEIERLRLTDAEREAVKKVLRRVREDYFAGRFSDSVEIAAVIDGLLERLGGER